MKDLIDLLGEKWTYRKDMYWFERWIRLDGVYTFHDDFGMWHCIVPKDRRRFIKCDFKATGAVDNVGKFLTAGEAMDELDRVVPFDDGLDMMDLRRT